MKEVIISLAAFFILCLFASFNKDCKSSIPEKIGFMEGDTVVLNYGTFKAVRIGASVYEIESPRLKEVDNSSISPAFNWKGSGFYVPNINAAPANIHK